MEEFRTTSGHAEIKPPVLTSRQLVKDLQGKNGPFCPVVLRWWSRGVLFTLEWVVCVCLCVSAWADKQKGKGAVASCPRGTELQRVNTLNSLRMHVDTHTYTLRVTCIHTHEPDNTHTPKHTDTHTDCPFSLLCVVYVLLCLSPCYHLGFLQRRHPRGWKEKTNTI